MDKQPGEFKEPKLEQSAILSGLHGCEGFFCFVFSVCTSHTDSKKHVTGEDADPAWQHTETSDDRVAISR